MLADWELPTAFNFRLYRQFLEAVLPCYDKEFGMKRKHEEADLVTLPDVEELTTELLEKTDTEKLLQWYGATLSPSDRKILQVLKHRSVEPMVMFGPKAAQPPTSAVSNPLYAHSVKANAILSGTIEEPKAYHTAFQYDSSKESKTSASYDMTFLIPLLCHILHEQNVCDGVKVVSYGWVYFILRGMALEDEVLKAESFLAFQRLMDNFERSKTKTARNKDAKLYLHVLTGLKRGIVELGECRISHLLSTWMVGVWSVLRLPSHSMFKRVTTALFAQPTIEMTILPQFIPFYNDGDEKRESRSWILNILYHGLKTREDWKIAQKSPTIKFLCSSFLIERVKTQRTIIAILTHGGRISEVAEEMTDKHSLPLWIANLKVTSRKLNVEIQQLFETIASTCPKDGFRDKIFEFVRRRKGWTEVLPIAKVEPNISDNDSEEEKEKEMEIDE